jgi:ADP-ribosylglycohydrolase
MTVDDKAIDRFRGCLIGLAIGDAIGTTEEARLILKQGSGRMTHQWPYALQKAC